MKKLTRLWGMYLKGLMMAILCLGLWATLQAQGGGILRLEVSGPINPVVADYIAEGINKARDEKASCVLIHLNTPGGLIKSTRSIVQSMLESRVPVVVYVAPQGAHAGSAGVFITLAAQVAAMAPGTNIGSAHPVSLQGGMDSIMGQKTTNDAAAFIRSIAEKRGRNAVWAEDAVRMSVALSETEAVKQNVVNLIANDEQDLLRQIHGWQVMVDTAAVTLKTDGLPVQQHSMSAVQKLLNYISDPNVAYVLMLIGLYGLLFELYSPGIGLPGVAGAISLILAFYAMHTLPLNVAGIALIGLAIALLVLELITPTHGILGAGAVVSLLLGSLMLIKPDADFAWARISLKVIIPAVAASGLFVLAAGGLGLRAQRRRVSTGQEGLIDAIGKAVTSLEPNGTVLVQGELWKASSKTPVEKGQSVRVVSVNGLHIDVAPVDG